LSSLHPAPVVFRRLCLRINNRCYKSNSNQLVSALVRHRGQFLFDFVQTFVHVDHLRLELVRDGSAGFAVQNNQLLNPLQNTFLYHSCAKPSAKRPKRSLFCQLKNDKWRTSRLVTPKHSSPIQRWRVNQGTSFQLRLSAKRPTGRASKGGAKTRWKV